MTAKDVVGRIDHFRELAFFAMVEEYPDKVPADELIAMILGSVNLACRLALAHWDGMTRSPDEFDDVAIAAMTLEINDHLLKLAKGKAEQLKTAGKKGRRL